MRITVSILILAVCGSGCKNLIGKREDDAPKPTGKIAKREAKDLVNYLNTQASHLQSISYTDVSIHTSENGRDNPRLGDSTLHAQKPRNFRLLGGTFATSGEVDLGSNEREFWMYVKRMDSPNFLYCSYEDFPKAAKRFPIPFETDWVMQALGMAEYPADVDYTSSVNEQQRKYILSYRTTTSAGQPVRRVVAFNADHDSGRKPVVSKHFIVDDREQVLATAEILSAKAVKVGTSYVQVPTEVVLEWPTRQFKMRLVMGGERVNENMGDRAAALFTRPHIQGANPIDLANYRFEPTARGQAPSRR